MSSSSSHERQVFNQVPPAPAVRRARAADPHQTGSGHAFPSVREIHKNAWLKRLSAPEKKGTSFIKKYEKHWVVFCVHDDVEALLEFYTEPKMGAAHKPNFTVSLNTCLHVSPSIIGQDNEYEFVITLPNQVIRLVAAHWDQMIEWVESLQGKLREMNILSPKDNVYSKLPESHCASNPLGRSAAVVTTRDPNSPLPPPPVSTNGFASSQAAEDSRPPEVQSNSRPRAPDPVDTIVGVEPPVPAPVAKVRRTARSTDRPRCSNSQRDVEVAVTTPNTDDGTSVGVPGAAKLSAAASETTDSLAVRIVDVLDEERRRESRPDDTSHLTVSPSVVVVNGGASTSNTSVVQVTCGDRSVSSVSVNPTPGTSSAATTVCVNLESPGASVSSSSPAGVFPSPTCVTNVQQDSHGNRNESELACCLHRTSAPLEREPQYAVPVKRSSSSENLYEHLFISPVFANLSVSTKPGRQNGQNVNVNSVRREDLEGNQNSPPLIPRRSRHHKNSGRSSSLGRLDQQRNPNESNDRRTPSRSNHRAHGASRLQSGKHSSRHHDHEPSLIPPAAGVTSSRPSNSEFRPMEAMIGVRSGEYRIRRDESALVGTSLQTKSEGDRSHLCHPAHVPLKEQQVMRLKAEIQHPAGVRIVLRKKDCVGSIALVDYLGGVWIAGWKQQQHPVLYYAFHVGDQVVKIAGVTVQNSAEAHRAIKMVSSMQVEFIIRRLPYGRVLVLKRSRDGEPLGIAIESNSGEIGDVVNNGLAAKQGLPPHAIAADGKSPCNWFLTEINNRPLSLLAKEGEVRERLNAVGKEISILVQPADLVKHMRKQLKSMKGFKDYLVV